MCTTLTLCLSQKRKRMEFPLFILFFKLLFCCPMTVFWAAVKGQTQSLMLITVVLMVFKLEDKKDFMNRLSLKRLKR